MDEDRQVVGYDGAVALGVKHPYGWVWRPGTAETGEDDATTYIVGAAGVPPVTFRPAHREAAPVTAEEAQAVWDAADGFVAAVNLMVECPQCQPEPDARDVADDWSDALDWGDADLRGEAEQIAEAFGWWKTSDGEWHAPSPEPGCARCASGYNDYGTGEPGLVSAAVVPAFPLDMQPSAWLQEMVREADARLSEAHGIDPVTRMRWDVTLGLIGTALRELPDLPPEGWWPKQMLRSHVEAVVHARETLRHEASTSSQAPDGPLSDLPFPDSDDEPF